MAKVCVCRGDCPCIQVCAYLHTTSHQFSQPEMLCYGCKTAAKTVSDHYFLVVALT